MNSLLVDTNVLIDYLRGTGKAVKYVEENSADFSISALSIAELFGGARSEQERENLQDFLLSFEILPVDARISEVGGILKAKYGPSHGIDLIDGIIAATSLTTKRPLVTCNKKHFPMLDNLIIPYRASH